ncbi:MAG: hypothetical protein WAU88_11460 [Candidatus Zixiibacteriota bacterium]
MLIEKAIGAQVRPTRVSKTALLVMAILLILSAAVVAAVPTTISYQGKVTTPSGAPVNNGTYSIAFRIYDDSLAGNLFWEEVKSVVTNTGLFTVQLGETNPLEQSTLSVSNLFLALKVGSDAEMTPRTRLASVPYAAMVGTVDGANGGMVIGDLTSTGQVSGSRNDASGGYFQTSDIIHPEPYGLVGKYSFTGEHNGYGIYGYSVPADHYGTGGKFEGGRNGVIGTVAAAGTTGYEYIGVAGSALATLPEQNATLYGVYGSGTGALNSYGLYGNAFGSASGAGGYYYGVAGFANGNGSNSHNYGGWFKASGGAYNTGLIAEGSTYAGRFTGDVLVSGNLLKFGGSFRIDHPLDPANKYLQHSFVESPDMKNIYDGVVRLDASGEAVVIMPDWFEALNQDFRYQLTAMGAPGPNLYIKNEISGNQFAVAGGTPGMKVSWMVTGVRHDVWAEAHRIQVEVPKDPSHVGTYLTPELFNKPKSMGETYQLSKQMDEAAKQSAESHDRQAATRAPEPPQK